MSIGRIHGLHRSRRFQSPAIWFGILAVSAGLSLWPARAQGPSGAAAAASGAAAAATASAPAPVLKKSAAAAAMDAAAEGNSAVAPAKTGDATPPEGTKETANGIAPAGAAGASPNVAAGPPLQGIAAQCVDLLKLAATLKAEVDKSTKDVLSIPVVRDAGEIEQLAKKMREAKH